MTDEEREDLNTFRHDLIKRARWWQWKAETLEKENEQLKAENAALKERLGKAVDKTIVSEMLAKYFDCPCNFSPLDEEMFAYCIDNCVDDNIECWIRVINKKCAELKGEKK